MFVKVIVTLVSLALVNAIQITSPSNSSGWTSSGPQLITWTSVSTDASNFTLQLITPSNPNSPITIATVQTSDATYTYTPSSSLSTGDNYRVNAVGASGTVGILAQSNYFSVTAGSSSISATSSGSSSSSTSASSTSGSASSTSGSASSTASTTSSSSAAASTSAKSGAGIQYSLPSAAGLLILVAGGMGIWA